MFLSSLFVPAFAITTAIRTNVLETKLHYRHESRWIVALMFYVLLRGNQCCIHQNKQKFGQRVRRKGVAIYFTPLSREHQMLPFCIKCEERVVYLTAGMLRVMFYSSLSDGFMLRLFNNMFVFPCFTNCVFDFFIFILPIYYVATFMPAGQWYQTLSLKCFLYKVIKVQIVLVNQWYNDTRFWY